MADPFASALDAIFHGPGSEAAEISTIYGQHIVDVRIIRSRADREARFGDGQMVAASCTVDIRRSQAPDLCPPTWHWVHRVPVELRAYKQTTPLRVVIDRIAGKIGAAIAADRFLGGLVGYLDVSGLDVEPLSSFGSRTELGATFDIVATYSSYKPL